MSSAHCDRAARLAAHKILIAGGSGSGKTTLVGAISEVRPLRTEETLTTASVGFDDLSGVGSKTTTTVALDFGRITMGRQVVLITLVEAIAARRAGDRPGTGRSIVTPGCRWW